MFKKINYRDAFALFFLPMVLSACSSFQAPSSETNVFIYEDVTPTVQNPPTSSPAIALPEPTLTATPSLETGDGPIILLQTKVDEYQLIDLYTLEQFPFELPGQSQLDSLVDYQSPGKQYLLYPLDQEQFIVIEILSNRFQTFNFPEDDNTFYDLDQAVETIQELLPNQFITYDGARFAVEESLRQSKQKIKWYRDDEAVLIVRESGSEGTFLFSLDFKNQILTQLEDIPGLVEDFWLSPGGDQILIKKGIVHQPNIWQDDQYLIIDPSLDKVIFLPLPQNISNPSVFWHSNDDIGVVHQQSFAGNEFFSLIDLSNMETTLIIPTAFSSIKSFGDHLISIYKEPESGISTITLWQINGEIIKSIMIQDNCSFLSKVDSERILVSCNLTSFLLEGAELNLYPLDDGISIFSRSPNREHFIVVTDSHQTYLVDLTFAEWRLIETIGDLLEVQWLPDSSGFLYRTAIDLYHFDLSSGNNRYILTSDLFADYKNLNLIWINTH
jgi:hypothetical protein